MFYGPEAVLVKVFSRLPQPEEGCWLWPGSKNSQGYGKVSMWGVGTFYIHRIAYGWEHGYVPPELDHLCRVRLCGRPSHLEAVSHQENMARGGMSPWDTCEAGHVYAEVGWWDQKHGRKCKACHRVRSLRAHYKRVLGYVPERSPTGVALRPHSTQTRPIPSYLHTPDEGHQAERVLGN